MVARSPAADDPSHAWQLPAQRTQLGAHGVADVRWPTSAIAEHAGRPAIGWWHVADGAHRPVCCHLRHAGPWPARHIARKLDRGHERRVDQHSSDQASASPGQPRPARRCCPLPHGADQHPPSSSATVTAAAGTSVSQYHIALAAGIGAGYGRMLTRRRSAVAMDAASRGAPGIGHQRRATPTCWTEGIQHRSACPGRHSEHRAAAVFRTRAAHGLACQPAVAGPRAPAAR